MNLNELTAVHSRWQYKTKQQGLMALWPTLGVCLCVFASIALSKTLCFSLTLCTFPLGFLSVWHTSFTCLYVFCFLSRVLFRTHEPTHQTLVFSLSSFL